MTFEHPDQDAEVRYDLGCAWYSDHGPFFSNLQFAWFGIGLPCLVATVLALLSACGLTFSAWRGTPRDLPSAASYTSVHYGPLLDVSDIDFDLDAGYADRDVHRWVTRGSCGAISYGVLLGVLGMFIILHANNEVKFSFFVDAAVAFAMFLSKVIVATSARTVHRHLSPLSRRVAKQWVSVTAASKALTAVCAMVLFFIYVPLGFQGVNANRGDGTRRRLNEDEGGVYGDRGDHGDSDHGPTPEDQAKLCMAGFFMVWSFLATLVSQSIAGFAFFRIYANAVQIFGDPFIFSKVVNCWWGILVISTCGVGIALWLGSALIVFPALDISPLRMMGLFYICAAACQILAGVAMLACNQRIRIYWKAQGATASSPAPNAVMGTVVGSTSGGVTALGSSEGLEMAAPGGLPPKVPPTPSARVVRAPGAVVSGE